MRAVFSRLIVLLLALLVMACVVGTLCAAFLWSLDAVTRARFDHPWLLFLLPLGGAGIGWLYHRVGQSVEGGNNLILDEIHEPGGGVPLRMAPLVFIGTVATHLFGGSAGREGTAVQLGGSIASAAARIARLDEAGVQILLKAGIAAGFGAVFGTPLAGAVFALEVLAIGRVHLPGLLACVIAGYAGDWACQAWGIHHTPYAIHYAGGWNGLLLLKATIAGALFGLASFAFAEANHVLGGWFKRHVRYGPARPFIGGLVLIALTYALGTRAYLGLGVWSADPHAPTIPGFFTGPIDGWSWALKMLFTIITLSTGFKGGEVTPLFFIGAGLGNALSGVLGGPVDLFAGLGFVAVFAGAANTPLACILMGLELFGPGPILPIALACYAAYACSGHNGIYLSQRVWRPKLLYPGVEAGVSLRAVRAARGRGVKR